MADALLYKEQNVKSALATIGVLLDKTDKHNDKKIIKRVNNKTMFSKYSSLKSLTRQKYPEVTPVNPSKSDYRIGSIMRYFTQKGNNRNADIFEVSKADFSSKNNLYRYTSFQWRISGKKEEVTRDNQNHFQNNKNAINGQYARLIQGKQ